MLVAGFYLVLPAQGTGKTETPSSIRGSKASTGAGKVFFGNRFYDRDTDTIRIEGINSLSGIEKFSNLKVLLIDNTDLFFNTVARDSELPKDPKQFYRGITDLKPLLACKKLEVFSLDRAEVQDISLLTQLPKLRSLALNYTPVSDIGPLSKMTQLEELQLIRLDTFPDLSPLKDLKNLEVLRMDIPLIKDISPVAGFSRLRILNLWGDEVANWESLDRAPFWKGLEELHVSGISMSKLPEMGAMPALKSFILSETEVTDLSQLALAPNLEYLYLNVERLDDTRLFAGLKALKTLRLTGGEINSIAKLSGCVKLEELELRVAGVKSLAGIENLRKLKTLRVFNSYISDLSPLQKLTGLEILDIQVSMVKDLAPIRSLKSLKVINLTENHHLTEIAVLGQLPQLEKVLLKQVKISSIASLLKLPKLETLDLSYTRITDLSALPRIKSLRKLYLNGLKASDWSPLNELEKLEVLTLYDASLPWVEVEALKKRFPDAEIYGPGW